MIRTAELTITPAVKATEPRELTIKLTKGTLTQVRVASAPGVNWEVYFRILHLENAIIPDANDQWIALSGGVLEYDVYHTDWHDVYNIVIQMCAPQARYSHTVNFTFVLQETPTAEQSILSLIEMGR